MDSNDKLALCSNGRRLVDYVVVCGLDLNNGLEPNSQQGTGRTVRIYYTKSMQITKEKRIIDCL